MLPIEAVGGPTPLIQRSAKVAQQTLVVHDVRAKERHQAAHRYF